MGGISSKSCPASHVIRTTGRYSEDCQLFSEVTLLKTAVLLCSDMATCFACFEMSGFQNRSDISDIGNEPLRE